MGNGMNMLKNYTGDLDCNTPLEKSNPTAAA